MGNSSSEEENGLLNRRLTRNKVQSDKLNKDLHAMGNSSSLFAEYNQQPTQNAGQHMNTVQNTQFQMPQVPTQIYIPQAYIPVPQTIIQPVNMSEDNNKMSMEERQQKMTDINNRKKDAKASGITRLIINAVLMLSVFCVLYMIAVSFIFEVDTIKNMSMAPTYKSGDIVWVNKFQYNLGSPSYGEAVIIMQTNGKRAIRRIMGLPGDEVLIKNGILYINGAEQKTEFDTMDYAGMASETIILKDGQYFVLGDNRNNCVDSRNESLGIVVDRQIIGKVGKKAPAILSFTGSNITD